MRDQQRRKNEIITCDILNPKKKKKLQIDKDTHLCLLLNKLQIPWQSGDQTSVFSQLRVQV